MYNKVILMGRITHDLELKATPNGANVCTFSIAVDRRYQPKGEDRKSDFFNVVAWRQQAEFLCRYFGKGRMILVEGELQSRSYTDKNGNEVRAAEILVERLSFTGEKKQEAADVHTAPTASQQTAAQAAAAYDDDYPF